MGETVVGETVVGESVVGESNVGESVVGDCDIIFMFIHTTHIIIFPLHYKK